jgi:hypothetical protein
MMPDHDHNPANPESQTPADVLARLEQLPAVSPLPRPQPVPNPRIRTGPEQARAQFDAALERLRYAFDAWTSAKHRQFEVILAPRLVLHL